MKQLLLTALALILSVPSFSQMIYNFNELKGVEVEIRKYNHYNDYWYEGVHHPGYWSEFFSFNGFALPYSPYNNYRQVKSMTLDLLTRNIKVDYSSGDSEDMKEYIDTIMFYNKYSDARVMADCCYLGIYFASSNPASSYLLYSQMASDDCYGGGGKSDSQCHAIDYLMSSSYNWYSTEWESSYKGVEICNQVLSKIDDAKMGYTTKEDLNDMKGEVYFLRAYYYYKLASMYGCVPLYTDNSATMEKTTQSTPARIWGQILLDLKTAASLMKSERKPPIIGHRDITYPARVDKYAVEAFIGRAWLFYTGMYCNGDKLSDMTSTNYSPLTSVELPDGTTMVKNDVIAYIDDVVNNSGAKLVPDYRTLWAYTNKYIADQYDYTNGLRWVEDDDNVNPEALFSIRYNSQASWSTTTGYSNIFCLYQGIRNYSSGPFGQGWQFATITPNLVTDWEKIEPNDLRRAATIQNLDDYKNSYTYNDLTQGTEYFNKKTAPIRGIQDDKKVYCFETLMFPDIWAVSGLNNFQLSSIHNQVLIRFADVLLMQSELKESVVGINKVRARANLDRISSYSLEALQNERRWELAGEYIRWDDIRRWHIAAEALSKQEKQEVYHNGQKDTILSYGGGYANRYNETAGFTHIPLKNMMESNWTLKQNPGWDDGSISKFSEYGKEASDMTEIRSQAAYDRYVFVQDSLKHVADSLKHIEDSIKAEKFKETLNNRMFSDEGKKKWKWANDEGGAWGNFGYTPCSGDQFLSNNYDDLWWGVQFEDGIFKDQEQHRGNDTVTGDDDQDAYMIFDINGTIKCYDKNDNEIRSGTFTLTYYSEDSRKIINDTPWSIATLHTTAGAILWPYAINTGGYMPTEFEIVRSRNDELILTYAAPETSQWQEATFWRFRFEE